MQLSSALRYALLVDHEGLDVEFVCKLLEIAFVSDLSGEEEEPEASVRRFHLVVENTDDLVDEFEETADFVLPVGFLV